MSAKVMIDSNVWIYAFMKGEDGRIATATALIEKLDSIVLSTGLEKGVEIVGKFYGIFQKGAALSGKIQQ